MPGHNAQQMMTGQARPNRPTPPSAPPPAPARPRPNSGPDKVKGEFDYNDEVYVIGQWSKLYYYLRPVDGSDDLVWVVRDCGCGGPRKVRRDTLVHKWHYMHGDATP